MHPSRYALLRGPTITYAPEDDRGSSEDIDDDFEDEGGEGLDDEAGEDDDEDLDVGADPEPEDDDDDEPVVDTRPARKTFAQRVEEKVALELAKRTPAPAPQQAPQQPQETHEQFRERIANMDQVQLAEYLLGVQNQTLAQIRQDAADRADRQEYEALARDTPIAGKLKDEVETRLKAMQANNLTAPRLTILKFLIGERALENKGRATSRATRTAETRRTQQGARPGNGRGDAQAEGRGRDSEAARDRRIENMQI